MQINKDILMFESRRWCSLPQLNMFNLMSNCCNWVSKLQQPMRKVTMVVVGLDKAGKTMCIRGMLRAPHGEVSPTHGCVRYELRFENFLVNLLDMGGSPEFRSCWREFYGEAHGVIFVVDSSDRHRMKEVKELLTEMLRQHRVAGKPLLVLANKQDKMNALLGSELIEALSLEKLVNQSQSLCHIEPCSALMDLRRWSDRKTLRGLRWLLRAVCLDYPDLCTRIDRDSGIPPVKEERERKGKAEKIQKKNNVQRHQGSKPDSHLAQCPLEEEQKNGNQLQTIRSTKENSLQKKLKKKKMKVKIKAISVRNDLDKKCKEKEVEGNEAENNVSSQEETDSHGLLRHKKRKLKPKSKVETLDQPESQESIPSKGKKKKKVIKGKRKNKINTEEIPVNYRQPADLAATFDLYRKAILALKARQDQSLVPEQ
ncbi:ADP-ribosylation factor-like protein 13A isoform X2 [Silurus meridionalis]|uniref:ADP-ribosylation factor-like protein 13A isoform X2 n=1 Tax=Silurus meridionalis TaxID=175797 RepID=UPI001EE9B65E|nr:ADP-ribosylation factor-like protein 13A isoform X2 [Silurus meridionalis]